MTTTQPQPTNTPTIPNPGVTCTFHHDGPLNGLPAFDANPADHMDVMTVDGIGTTYTVWVSGDPDIPPTLVVTCVSGPSNRAEIRRYVAASMTDYAAAFAYVCSVVVAMVADEIAAEMSYQ